MSSGALDARGCTSNEQAALHGVDEHLAPLLRQLFSQLADGQAALEAKLTRIQATLDARCLPSPKLPPVLPAGQRPQTPREHPTTPTSVPCTGTAAAAEAGPAWQQDGSVVAAAPSNASEGSAAVAGEKRGVADTLADMYIRGASTMSMGREPTTRTTLLRQMISSELAVGQDSVSELGHSSPSFSSLLLRTESHVTRNEWMLHLFSLANVCLYLIFLAALVDTEVKCVQQDKEFPALWGIVDIGFIVALCSELLLFVRVHGRPSFAAFKLTWEAFDVFVLAISLVHLLVKQVDTSGQAEVRFLAASRMIRACRFARVIRNLRDMQHLRLMVAAILSSLSSICWAIVLLSFIIYLFAVGLLSFLTDNALDSDTKQANILHEFFDGLLPAMLTLFASISGGLDWYEVMTPVIASDRWFARTFFVSYISLVLFGVMNILTAVFVRNAGHVEKIDRKLVIMEERQKTAKATAAIKKLMAHADADKDGVITREELERQLERHETLLYLRRLDIDDADVRRLFMLLADGASEVQDSEFLDGLLRLRGAAKTLDAASLMIETKRRGQEIRALLRYIEDRFDEIPIENHPPKRIAEYIDEEREEFEPWWNSKQRIDSLAAIGRVGTAGGTTATTLSRAHTNASSRAQTRQSLGRKSTAKSSLTGRTSTLRGSDSAIDMGSHKESNGTAVEADSHEEPHSRSPSVQV